MKAKVTTALRLVAILTLSFATAFGASAASFKEAKVSEVVRDVSLLVPPATVEPAAVGDRVAGTTTVRTGVKSRTELTFPDSTLLRLGSNTQFSFIGEERDFDLERGTAVLKTTKSSGGANIRSGGVTAAITGSMAAVAKPPPGQAGFVKLLLFYGEACMLVPDKKLFGFGGGGGKPPKMKKVCIDPGQMAVVAVDKNGQPTGDVQVLFFDAALTAETSKLMNPNEDVLKANLEILKREQEGLRGVPTVSASDPVTGSPDLAVKSEGALGRLFSFFGPQNDTPEETPEANPMEGAPDMPVDPGPRCPEGFFFDEDFQECFPGGCPEGYAFDHISRECIPLGGEGTQSAEIGR